MTTISIDSFLKNPMKYMREAMNGDYCKVTAENGQAAVVIEETEWTMLCEALKICMEHSEWVLNK